jgi:hypothetical protein
MTSTRLDKYKDALARLSARTGASVPSLCASFLVLHEITAILPFIGVFYASRGLGVGETVVSMVLDDTQFKDASEQRGWARAKAREWVDEGGQLAERLGRRYGLFGFEKRSKDQASSSTAASDPTTSQLGGKVAGDVANVIVAYGVVKVRALLLFGSLMFFY